MGQYFYLDGNAPVGPFSLQDVYTLLDREVVGPTTLVCKEGGAEWLTLQSVPEFKGKPDVGVSIEPDDPASAEPVRRRRKGRANVTAIVIAFLFAVVAIYITYTISRALQESAQNSLEMDRQLGR